MLRGDCMSYKLKILLAEDDLKTASLIYDILSQNPKYEIKWVENGLLALETALKENPDVILMDIQMPVLDGIEATKRLRNKGYMGYIIAFTAMYEKETCLNSGMNDYIKKPFSVKELLDKFNKLVLHKNIIEEVSVNLNIKTSEKLK